MFCFRLSVCYFFCTWYKCVMVGDCPNKRRWKENLSITATTKKKKRKTEMLCWKMQEPQLRQSHFRVLKKLNSEQHVNTYKSFTHCQQIDIFFSVYSSFQLQSNIFYKQINQLMIWWNSQCARAYFLCCICVRWLVVWRQWMIGGWFVPIYLRVSFTKLNVFVEMCVCVCAKIKAPLNHKNHSNRNELENKRKKPDMEKVSRRVRTSGCRGAGVGDGDGGANKCVNSLIRKVSGKIKYLNGS